MGIHTPRVRNETSLQSEPRKRGLSYFRHISGKLMTVEIHYTCIIGKSNLFACLFMHFFHLLMHFFHYLVVYLPLVQLVWQGASILIFLRMFSPYCPNWSPINIYHPPPVLLPPSKFDPLFPFVTLSFCVLHTTLLWFYARSHFDTATDRVFFFKSEKK